MGGAGGAGGVGRGGGSWGTYSEGGSGGNGGAGASESLGAVLVNAATVAGTTSPVVSSLVTFDCHAFEPELAPSCAAL